MATTQLPTGSSTAAAGDVLKRPQYRVSVREKWADPWDTKKARYLQPLQATAAAAPNKSKATFVWHFGRIKHEDRNQFSVEEPRDFRGHFVRIELLGGSGSSTGADTDLWVGRIGANDQAHAGVTANSSGSVATGEEQYDAFGLEHELDRNPVRGAFVTNDGDKAFFVDTPIVFNERYDRRGPTDVGNRTAEKLALADDVPEDQQLKVHVFDGRKPSGSAAGPSVWTVGDIVRYLLVFYAPPELGFTLAGAAEALDGIVLPRVDLNGRTVFESLNYLIDRRRGLGWCVRLSREGGTTKPTIYVYSVLDETVQFEDATIPANSDQLELRLDDLEHLVDGAAGLQYDVLNRYGKIVVSGQRVQVCFTAAANEQIFKGWTDADETKYKNGAGVDDAKKNDQARGDPSLDHVFSHFHFKPDFNWKATGSNANPLVSDTGHVKVGDSKQAPIRNWGHRVERTLPFKSAKQTPDAEPEFERPFAMVQDTTGRLVMTHSGVENIASLVPLDATFGVAVKFSPNHLLAKGLWTGAKPTNSNHDPDAKGYSWTTLKVTLAVRTDERLEVVVELDKDGPFKERILHIEVPDAELHYVVPNTIKGVDDAGNKLITTTGEAIARDDSGRLRKIAALAKAWVGRERAALSVTVHAVWLQYSVGSLVRSVDDRLSSKPVNTPISQVIWDLVRATTTIRTSWAEFDATAGRSAGPKRTH